MIKSLHLFHFCICRVCTYLSIGLLTLLSNLSASADQPTIGLVLSGGGARGAAHIGVLKYLEANNIPVDIITGTSFGAIVGGLYASGMSAAEIEEAMLGMDWARALTDDVS
ncbi:MAG: patatin-like phospholipase family protein [Gammaproteobacteria bacterium]